MILWLLPEETKRALYECLDSFQKALDTCFKTMDQMMSKFPLVHTFFTDFCRGRGSEVFT